MQKRQKPNQLDAQALKHAAVGLLSRRDHSRAHPGPVGPETETTRDR